ncbi:MAG: hypothetical protein IJ489_04145 [Clostridia bacterium]|nr:hypothetical protein [Clostridia bacterium]
MSVSSFAHQFKREIGISPREYILQQRLFPPLAFYYRIPIKPSLRSQNKSDSFLYQSSSGRRLCTLLTASRYIE